MADSREKRELIAKIDRARSLATAHQRELKEDLKIREKVHEFGDELKGDFKESVDQHRGIWLGAAAIVGLLIAKIPPRTKVLKAPRKNGKVAQEAEAVGKAGLFFTALGWIFSLVRPFLVTWGKRKLQEAIAGNAQRGYRRI